MRFSKIAILLLLMLSVFAGYAQTFNVTSNADSGPGTLRAALLAIPAIRTNPAVINFNLNGTDLTTDTYRTIRLKSQLPNIPSNVIIDGSTQTVGAALGVSGAKVIIEPEDVSFLPSFTSCFTIGNNTVLDAPTTDVEIYGLYIKDFARITNIQSTTNQASGIILDARAKNVKIGAPGKGNVISGNQNGISIRTINSYLQTVPPVTDISIRSNIIGLHYDGVTAKTNLNGINGVDFRDGGITIGGDNSGDGNLISANKININIRVNSGGSNRFGLNIVNNNVGSDTFGTGTYRGMPLFNVPSTVEISGIKIDALNTNLHVRGNIIVGNKTNGLSIANADFVVTGNMIGTGKLGTELLGNGVGIKIESGGVGTIGGDTDEKTNKIANNDYGIESASNRPVTISRNSMYCNRLSSIGETTSIAQPFVQILIIRPDFLSGRATPNATIELFYTMNCNGLCEGKQYIATARTGSDGRWTYNGNLTGQVTATATLLNYTTSPFSTAAVRPEEIIIEPVTCNGKGSIDVPEPREGITFKWFRVLDNGTRIPIVQATPQKIIDLDEGNYILVTDDGCRAMETELLQVKDQRMTDLVVNWPVEQCGQTSFQFSATVQRGKGVKTFMWINQDGVTVRTGSQVTLPPGTYKLVVRDEANCELAEQGREFKIRPIPAIVSSIQPRPAKCGFADGEITGLSIGGVPTGLVTYKWNTYNSQVPPFIGAQVGDELQLRGVAGGTYILTITDEGNCTPVTRIFTVPIIESVVIRPGQITSSTCNLPNGRISNVRVDEADFIQWIAPGGAILEQRAYSPGEALQLIDRAPGTYTLRARNTVTGCADTETFRIDEIIPTDYRLTERVTNATCGLNNGQISLNFTTVTPVRFEWRDATGIILTNGTISEIKDLAPGTYSYFTYDANGCSNEFGPYRIEPVEILSIDNTAIPPANDGCSLSRGAVTGLQARGGIPPYRYSWEDENGLKVRNNQTTPDLIGVPAGKYRMILEDNTSCGKTWSNYYTVENHDFSIEAPVAAGINVCYATEITIKVVGPAEGKYQLFKDKNDASPAMESPNGVFVFKVSKTGDYYIRRQLGSCYSDFTPVHIEVTNDNLEIKNTMTPNGDGMNDYWMISGLPDHADINIKIYTRSGQLVYESVGPYSKPFDGRFRGKELPAGAYYYRIDLRADCKPIAGSITLLR